MCCNTGSGRPMRMSRARNSSTWELLAVIGLLLCLIAMLAHPAHVLSAAALLLPVLLFGLVPVPRSLWPGDNRQPASQRQLARSTPFQRPPPRSSR